ncbi:MAG: hypothetical protein C0603_06300 [Denitrovibrio sp.]|nr:MAG: hypothetical protein C0603_06300 [Denitrovibrio sp.]
METNYKLLDTGSGKKLEQFGDVKLVRTAKQAFWKPSLPANEWGKVKVRYKDEKWIGEIDDFTVTFGDCTFSLGLLETGQIGIFPEQLENWKWLQEITKDKDMKIINGFAYTGGSTLFCSTPNTEVVHLDSSKPSITRAKKNLELSGKSENKVRFINDDVVTFLEKEVQRGNRYDGFVFDPPAFGRGGKGKTWKLSKDLSRLIELIGSLSDGSPKFVLITAHDPDMDGKILENYIRRIAPKDCKIESGDLIMKSDNGRSMRNGYFARFSI